MRKLLAYPFEETVASADAKAVLDDSFGEVVAAVLSAYAAGEVEAALKQGHEGYKVGAGAVARWHVKGRRPV